MKPGSCVRRTPAHPDFKDWKVADCGDSFKKQGQALPLFEEILISQPSAFYLDHIYLQLFEQRRGLIQLRARFQIAGLPLNAVNWLVPQNLVRTDGVGHIFGVLLAEERSLVGEESVQAFGGEGDERREHDLQ